ncbi:MAG: hypothetical protein K2L38_04635 [Dysosmobacter sp.]|nr:hypothetical protein [Dysosmobacter sp.]
MNSEIPKALYDKTLEQLVMTYVSNLSAEEVVSKLNAEAMDLLSDVLAILDDDALEDPECFRRIDEIVSAFWAKGIYTPRHDW